MSNVSRKPHQNRKGECFPYAHIVVDDEEDEGYDRREYDQLLENTTMNSFSLNDDFQSEALFHKLGLRHFGRLQHSSKSKYYGYAIISFSIFIGVFFLYAAVISKCLPDSGIYFLDVVKHDKYFCYLVPLTVLPTILARYINWLAKQHFEQNWSIFICQYHVFRIINKAMHELARHMWVVWNK